MNQRSAQAEKCGRDVRRNVTAALEFFQALGLTWIPGKADRHALQQGFQGGMHEQTADRIACMSNVCEEVRGCTACKLHRGRTHAVCGEGASDAQLMFIGEAPGKEEDIQGLPFVGDAGMLLTRMIEKMGFKRQEVFIANIIKCRPPMNRDPEDDEVSSCLPFLVRQIEIVRPKIIVSLGRIALQSLMDDPRLKISAVRGRFFQFRGIPVMPTFHPAYLLRNPKDKWQTWSDMEKVLDMLRTVQA